MNCPFQSYGFVFGCIPIRLLIVYIIYRFSHHIFFMQCASLIAAFTSAAFFIIFFTKSRKSGREVCNKKIWWNHLRPFHASTYFIFAILAISPYSNYAYIPLLIDVIIGTMFHIHNRFKK
jgi:amino acid transporter